jgi:hypothetical protein
MKLGEQIIPMEYSEQELIKIAEKGESDLKAKMAMYLLRENYDSTYGWCNDCDFLVCKKRDCCLNRIDNQTETNRQDLLDS